MSNSPDCLSLGPGSRGLPVVGKQFVQPGDGVRRGTREDVAEPGKRFNAATLAGGDEAPQHGRRSAAAAVPFVSFERRGARHSLSSTGAVNFGKQIVTFDLQYCAAELRRSTV